MKIAIRHWAVWTGALCFAFGNMQASARLASQDRATADALFTNGAVLHVRIEIPSAGIASLRKEPRKSVKATIREGDLVYTNVGIHLKGSAGSFRTVDDKPGLTLNVMAFGPNSRFHGLKKFHLNNSVQDPSFLSEWLCGDLFRSAGVPAARAAHALVELNGRRLGLCVLLESMDRDFLSRYFKDTKGNVYGQAGNGEITSPLERMEGKGPLDRADLKALAAAVLEADPVRRWERVQQKLDVDRFLSFMALEVMLCDWDGYTFAQHNYRVYHDLDTDRMVFFPHDKDQEMGDPNVPIIPGARGLVAQTILRMPETRDRYRERFAAIFTNLFVVSELTDRIKQRVALELPTLKAYDAALAQNFQGNAEGLKSRILNRAATLGKQINVPAPKPLKFESDIAKLTGWRKASQKGGANLDQKEQEGKPTLWIGATGDTFACWRLSIRLNGGHYRFEGLARTAGVVSTRSETKGEGAGLRISRNEQPRANKLAGNSPWQKLAYDFDVTVPNQEVELVCELRATKGDVWFDLDSLRLVRMK